MAKTPVSPTQPAPARPAAAKPAAPPPAPADPLDLLAQLSNASGVSGDEGAVRKIILEAIQGWVDSAQVDALGNILAVKKGKGPARVLVAAHMDEVGLMVTGADSDGALRVAAVGGLDDRVLAGKPVLVGPKRLPGVIGAAPIHLLSAERRMSIVKLAQLRVDIGAESAEAAKRLVKPGERVVFATEFAVIGPSLRGKALDDRLSCATLVELLRGGPYPFELHAAFTVQEEVGLRGARVAAYAVDPLCAFVLDCTPALDLPASQAEKENTQYNTHLDRGPAIYLMDRETVHDQRLVRHLTRVAVDANLPHQFRQPGGGATDAGAIHKARKGIPTVSVSVPGRYLHTPASLVRAADWRNTVELMRLALEKFSPQILKK